MFRFHHDVVFSGANVLVCQLDVLDGVPSDEMMSDKLCDLSAWRVTIPKIRAKPELLDNPRKHMFVFCIEVHRVDITEGVCCVGNLTSRRQGSSQTVNFAFRYCYYYCHFTAIILDNCH